MARASSDQMASGLNGAPWWIKAVVYVGILSIPWTAGAAPWMSHDREASSSQRTSVNDQDTPLAIATSTTPPDVRWTPE